MNLIKNKFRHDMSYFYNTTLGELGLDFPTFNNIRIKDIINNMQNIDQFSGCNLPGFICIAQLHNSCTDCIFKKENIQKLYNIILSGFMSKDFIKNRNFVVHNEFTYR